jgi:hypothetical protein
MNRLHLLLLSFQSLLETLLCQEYLVFLVVQVDQEDQEDLGVLEVQVDL